MEDEAAGLRRLPEVLAEPHNLPRSKGGELPDEASTAERDGVAMATVDKDAPVENDQMVVDDDPREPKNRGSNAVEDRIEHLPAEISQEARALGDGVPTSEMAFQARKVSIGRRFSREHR